MPKLIIPLSDLYLPRIIKKILAINDNITAGTKIIN
jgi:hypothetical protein